MKLRTGDMWSAWEHVDLFLITTNSYVKKDGRLVMGRGMAREAAERFPDLPYAAGGEISHVAGWRYGLIADLPLVPKKLGLFQVKYGWWEPADLGLIRLSTAMLRNWCDKHPQARVALNFPGIGNGRLAREDVLPIIGALPDAVEVWERGDLILQTF